MSNDIPYAKRSQSELKKGKRGGSVSNLLSKIYQHPVRTLVIVAVIMLIFPLLILLIIKLADSFLPVNCYTRLADGINTWLSFWGSYLGCVATVILSVGAILINEKINRYTLYQNTSNEVGAFNSFEVKDICLYDLSVDHPGFLLEVFETYDGQRFLMIVTFEKSFPPQYEVKVEEVTVSKDLNVENGGNQFPEPDSPLVVTCLVSNCNATSLYILLNYADLEEFYNLHLTRKPIAREEKYRWLSVRMQCENTLFHNNKHDYYRPLRVTLGLWLKNVGIINNSPQNVNPVLLRIEKRKLCCETVETP